MMRAPVLASLGLVLLGLGQFALASECEDAEDGSCDLKQSTGNTLVQTQSVHVKQSTMDMSAEAIDTRSRLRARLLIESDLGALHESSYRGYQTEEDIDTNINEAWRHFVNTTDLADELTSTELELYRERFVDEMHLLTKHNGTSPHVWLQELTVAFELEKPVATEALIDSLNAANLGFTAALQPFMSNMSRSDLDLKLGKQSTSHSEAAFLQRAERGRGLKIKTDIPDTFDPRTAAKWAACSGVIGRVHNQGTCGSCWAFGSLSAIDSRLCIASDGQFQGQLSRGFLTSCGKDTDGDGRPDNGCAGGMSYFTMDALDTDGGGIPTGSSSGCSPYFGHGSGTEHFGADEESPACPTQCGNAAYGTGLHADKVVLAGMSGYNWVRKNDHGYFIELAKWKLYESGPLPMGMKVEESFFSYSSGVWNDGCSSHSARNANHEVVAIGYGSDFIIGLNSWGEGFGMGGSFKFATACATDFTIPVDISLPLTSGPLPSPPPSTSPPPSETPGPAPSPNPSSTTTAFTISSGTGCSVDGLGCILSKNYAADSMTMYPNNEHCTVQVGPADGVMLEVADFNTEGSYDILTVNGNAYSGAARTLQGEIATGEITWSSDFSVSNLGWKICPKAPPDTSSSTRTAKGCECLEKWSYYGVDAQGCANPDGDPTGDWCQVLEPKCQGANWGYC